MSIRSLIVVLLAAWLCMGCASRSVPARAQLPHPEDSVVRVDPIGPDGAPVRPCAGTVILGGRVVTALDSVKDAKEVWVTSRTGHRCRVAGVIGSSPKYNIIIFTVNWAREYPPPLRMADPPPPGRANVSVLPAPGLDGLAPLQTEATIPEGAAALAVWSAGVPDFHYFGSPTIDSQGRLLGVVARLTTGMQVSASTSPVKPVSYYTAYGERVISYVETSTETPWNQWAAASHK